jgi:hypothetical protein
MRECKPRLCGRRPAATSRSACIRRQRHHWVNAAPQFAAFLVLDICTRRRIGRRRLMRSQLAKARDGRAKPLRHGGRHHARNLQRS